MTCKDQIKNTGKKIVFRTLLERARNQLDVAGVVVGVGKGISCGVADRTGVGVGWIWVMKGCSALLRVCYFGERRR